MSATAWALEWVLVEKNRVSFQYIDLTALRAYTYVLSVNIFIALPRLYAESGSKSTRAC